MLKSVCSAWRGFTVERHASRTPVPSVEHASWHKMQLALITRGQFITRYRAGLIKHHHVAPVGHVFINPAGYEVADVRSSGKFECLLVQVDGPLLNPWLTDAETLHSDAVLPQQNIADVQIASLLTAMQNEIEAGCPAGRLYAESLSVALGSYIIGRFATRAEEGQQLSGKLSQRQCRHLSEFVNHELEHELSIIKLASVVGLSARHFTRLFRNTYGESPHKFVTRIRVQRAKALLVERHAAISDIALAVGFESQSYFTHVFHQITGTTPRRYRLDS